MKMNFSMNKLLIFGAAILLGVSFLSVPSGDSGDDGKPRLVVQITVDQLRGDMLTRFKDCFGPDGFRRFMRRGVW